MSVHKGATSQDDSIAKVANFAAQLLWEREFALLLVNDLLSLGQFKGRPVLVGGQSAPHEQMLAILGEQFLPRAGRGQTQNGSDLLPGGCAAPGQRLGIPAVAILLGVCAQSGSNRVQSDVGSHRGCGPASFQQKTLKALGPQNAVAAVAAVEPLGKAAFELFEKDRKVIHALAIGFQQAVALLEAIGLLSVAGQLLLERLGILWAIVGFDTLQHFALGQSSGFGHFTQEMKVIGHQNVLQNPNPAESLLAAHQEDKMLSLDRPTLRSPEDEPAFHNPGDAVVKTLTTLSFDTWETHGVRAKLHNI